MKLENTTNIIKTTLWKWTHKIYREENGIQLCYNQKRMQKPANPILLFYG